MLERGCHERDFFQFNVSCVPLYLSGLYCLNQFHCLHHVDGSHNGAFIPSPLTCLVKSLQNASFQEDLFLLSNQGARRCCKADFMSGGLCLLCLCEIIYSCNFLAPLLACLWYTFICSEGPLCYCCMCTVILCAYCVLYIHAQHPHN